MSDPNARVLGQVYDTDGIPLQVGVDYDTVTIGGQKLDQASAEVFAHLLVAACWQAGEQRMHVHPADLAG
jgi:hypothetical protein